MSDLSIAVRRDQIRGQPTIKTARQVHGGLWHVTLAWEHGGTSDVLAVRRHACTPMSPGTRVHAELLRIGDSVAYILT